MDFFSQYLLLVSQSLVGRRIESVEKVPKANRWSLRLDNGETLAVIGDRNGNPVILSVRGKDGKMPETWRMLDDRCS